jgi:thioredoxin-like negative regulator of GroEL
MKPIVHRLEEEYWGRIEFLYLDRENSANSDVVEQFGISGQPVFILLAPDGSEIQRWFGSPDPAEFRAAFDSYLAG